MSIFASFLIFSRFYYIVVYEAEETPERKPNEYTNGELLAVNYEDYKKARKNGETKPYITAVLTRNKYKQLNGTFIIGQEQQQQQQLLQRRQNNAAAPTTKWENGKLFANTQYFFFIRAHISEVRINLDIMSHLFIYLFFYLWMFTQDSLFNANELLSMRVLPSLRNTYKRRHLE